MTTLSPGPYEAALRQRHAAALERMRTPLPGNRARVKPKRVSLFQRHREAREARIEEVVQQAVSQREVWRTIVLEVAQKHRLTLDQLRGQRRSPEYVLARHEVCYRLYTETGMSLPAIGSKLGGRDHTTILHGIRKHCQRNRLSLPPGMTWSARVGDPGEAPT